MPPEIIKGLKDVYFDTTESSFIDGIEGKLLYRGYNIHDLAEKSTFEEVVYLLLYGDLPNKKQLADFDSLLRANRIIPDDVIQVIDLVKTGHPMDVLRTAISALGSFDPEVTDNSVEATIRKGIRLTAMGPTIVAAHHRLRQGLEPVAPNPDLNHAGNFLYMLFDELPNQETTDLLDVDFILHAEHGPNASAFAARVTASTVSDLHSAVTTGVGTLKGPAHGGAAEEVMKMALDIGNPENAAEYASNLLDNGDRIMGFGHRVYRAEDPGQAPAGPLEGPWREEWTPRVVPDSTAPGRKHDAAVPLQRHLRERGLLRRVDLLPAGDTRRPVYLHICSGAHPWLDATMRGTVQRQHLAPAAHRIYR